MHNLLHCNYVYNSTSSYTFKYILMHSLAGYYKSENKIEKKTGDKATKSIEGKTEEEKVKEKCNYLPFLLVMEHYTQSKFN